MYAQTIIHRNLPLSRSGLPPSHSEVDVLFEQSVIGQVTGKGSLVGIHLTPRPVRDYRSAASARHELRELLHLACLKRGLFISRGCILNTSTAMSGADVTQAVQIFQDALVELRPAIEVECPELIR